MNAPFIFGRIAYGENFTDREKETDNLVKNFTALVNSIIISPRRWGKSSLVTKVSEIAVKEDTRLSVCRIDLFNIRTEEQFYQSLAMAVLKSTSTKWQEAVESARKFLKQIVPKITIGSDPANEFSLSFDWNEVKKNPDEILDLAENLATTKRLRIVICIDEFQNISSFEDPVFFQKKMRSHWQTHKNVAYCLFGSKRHMMLDVFTNSSMPFYKFGEIMFLEKIDTLSWIRFLISRFSSTGKKITEEQAKSIVMLADNHPYYVQQLAQQVWLMTEEDCRDETVELAFGNIIAQLSLLFATITESLTSSQINLLKALVSGETSLSSAEVLRKYRLTSSANVSRSRKALIDKEILDTVAGDITFQDPVYHAWLAREYFG